MKTRERQDELAGEKLQLANANGTRELNIFCGNSFDWNNAPIILTTGDLAKLGHVAFEKKVNMRASPKKYSK